MPLFGKKKETNKAPQPASGYPSQSYPTQSYPAQPQQGYPQQQQQGYPGAPPPYAAVPPQAQYAPPPGGAPPVQYGAPPAQYNPNQTVVVQGGFDAGARFGQGTGAVANIPPPPPGVAPNAAQMAQGQGANVVMTQRPDNFWAGGSDGGYTVW